MTCANHVRVIVFPVWNHKIIASNAWGIVSILQTVLVRYISMKITPLLIVLNVLHGVKYVSEKKITVLNVKAIASTRPCVSVWIHGTMILYRRIGKN